MAFVLEGPELLTLRQVAEVLRVGYLQIEQYTAEGLLSCYVEAGTDAADRGNRRYLRCDVEELANTPGLLPAMLVRRRLHRRRLHRSPGRPWRLVAAK